MRIIMSTLFDIAGDINGKLAGVGFERMDVFVDYFWWPWADVGYFRYPRQTAICVASGCGGLCCANIVYFDTPILRW